MKILLQLLMSRLPPFSGEEAELAISLVAKKLFWPHEYLTGIAA